jgi:lipid-A-disaccharide synthase
MKRTVDRVAVVLPFETKIYLDAGMHAEFVGHPFLTDHELPAPRPQDARAGVALLPGSRTGEVRTMLPLFLAAAAKLTARRPGLRVTVSRSPVVDGSLYEDCARRAGIDVAWSEGSVEVLSGARCAMVASGTATLESALLETPLVVGFRTGALNYALARRVVKIPNIGLVNVLLGEQVAPELVQDAATPDALASSAGRMLDDDGFRDGMVERFRALRGQLAQGRGSARVAEMAAELLA